MLQTQKIVKHDGGTVELRQSGVFINVRLCDVTRKKEVIDAFTSLAAENDHSCEEVKLASDATLALIVKREALKDVVLTRNGRLTEHGGFAFRIALLLACGCVLFLFRNYSVLAAAF